MIVRTRVVVAMIVGAMSVGAMIVGAMIVGTMVVGAMIVGAMRRPRFSNVLGLILNDPFLYLHRTVLNKG